MSHLRAPAAEHRMPWSPYERETAVSAIFNPSSFLRHAPNSLLEQFLSPIAGFAGFNWSAVNERRVQPILDRCNALPAAERAQIFDVFRTVESLANPIGTQVLIESARAQSIDIAAVIAEKTTAHERALWCYLHDKRIFRSACMLAHIDGLPKRSWATLKHLPSKPVEVTPEMLSELGQRFSKYFWATQVRGDKCVVEHRRREGDVDCFFAYPADYVEERFGYDEDGEFEFQRRKPAFDVVIAYDRMNGTTDIYAQGGRNVRNAIAEIFARVVLGADEVPEQFDMDLFDLEAFKNPNITFPTQPGDNITLVRPQAMRLQFYGRHGGRIMAAVDARSKEASVYELIADKLAERHARLTNATVVGVTMQAFFWDANERERSLMFKISAPAFCDLEDSPEEQRLRWYLRAWGIEKDADDLATAA